MPVTYNPQTVTGTVTANAGTGTFNTTEVPASTSSVTSVPAALASTTLVASNANRKGFSLYNNSTANLYLKFGTGASTSSFTVKIAAGGFYEMPKGMIYSGEIDGIWDVANGTANITELS